MNNCPVCGFPIDDSAQPTWSDPDGEHVLHLSCADYLCSAALRLGIGNMYAKTIGAMLLQVAADRMKA